MRDKISIPFNAGRRLSLAAAFFLILGCGTDGEIGPVGPAGPPGPAGSPGEPGQPGVPAPVVIDIDTWDKLLVSIGGQDALDGLTGFSIEGSGVRKIGGEGVSHTSPSQDVDFFDISTHMDLANDALRVDWNRSLLLFGGLPLTYSEIVNGNLGYVEGDDSAFGPGASTTDMPSGRWAAVRKQTMLLNPHLLLSMVNADPGLVSAGSGVVANDIVYESLVIQDDISPISLLIDPSSGQFAGLQTMENDHLHRDIPLEVWFDDWAPSDNGSAKFPMRVTMMVNGQVWHEEFRTSVTENPTFGTEFDFPGGAAPVYDETAAMWGAASHQFIQGFNSLGITQNVQQLTIVPEMIEDYVYLLGGSSHNSMAIEQESGVVIIEPPLYPERGEAILSWVQTNIGKPVTHVIVTHHHHDHSAGFRAFVAAGATVIVEQSSAGYLAEIATRPSTIVPDTQATAPGDVRIQGIGTSFPISTNSPFPNVVAVGITSGHANDMVVVYIAADTGNEYLFQSDLFNPDPAGPGFALFPAFAQELLDAINILGLNNPGTTLVGGHGSYAPLTQLEDFLAAQP